MSKISIPKFVFLASKLGRAKSPDIAPPVPGSKAISSCSREIGGGGESSSGGGSSSSGSGGGLQEEAEEEEEKLHMNQSIQVTCYSH